MTRDAGDAIEQVRAVIAALVVDPGVRVRRGEVGGPATTAALRHWREEVPGDLLDALALADGIECEWEAVDEAPPGQEHGLLCVPALAALTIARDRDGVGYVLVDGRARGMASYYRVPGPTSVEPPDVVYTLRGDEARQSEVVCDDLLDYLVLAADRRFAASWIDDVAYQRNQVEREADRAAEVRAADALGAEPWRDWRAALWGTAAEIERAAARFDDAALPALLDAGEVVAAGLGRLAAALPATPRAALVTAIAADPRPRLRRAAFAAWAAAPTPLLAEPAWTALLARALDDPDAGVRRAAAALATGHPDLAAPLERALSSPDPGLRAWARRALG